MNNEKQIVHGKELLFDEVNHLYAWGGSPVPGVTTVLDVIASPALTNWKVGVTRDYWLEAVKSGRTDYQAIHKESWTANKRIAKDAADIGTNVHKYAECVLKNQALPALLNDPAKRGAEAFHKWYQAHKIRLIASERIIFSKEYYYAGTCDLVAEIDGELAVGDFKTSSGIYPKMRFQTAAYQKAIEEQDGVKFACRWLIRFDKKTGDFEAKQFRDHGLDFRGFHAALELHRALQAITG